MRSIKRSLPSVVFIFLVIFVCYLSFGKALESFFWKDDWAWLWTANYNPGDFSHTTVGDIWFIRAGVFMYPYVLYFHKLITNSYYWQLIGLGLKIVNSFILYFLVLSVSKKKYLAILAAFIFASYSGGIESYTWYKLSALAASFVLLGFTFYSKFLETVSNRYLVFTFFSFVLAFMSNMGRPAGLIPVVVLWAILEFFGKDRTNRERKKIVISAFSILLPYLVLIKVVNFYSKTQPGLIIGSLQKIDVFFGVVGNLLKNPFTKYFEIGYLYEVDKLGIVLGIGLFIVGIILGIVYLVTRNRYVKYLTISIAWIYLFYYPNWIYGGGGITTILGSGHRYLALSGVGLVLLWVVLLSRFKKPFAIIFSLLLIFLNIRYSKHLISLESAVRNRNLVEPIYKELDAQMKNDDNVQLIVLHTPNILKSYVVQGWYPYTYAYYKGLKDITDFPVVFPYWDQGVEWVCASDEDKRKVQTIGGFANNRKSNNINIEHIYAWNIDLNGQLKNRTEELRSVASNCPKK